jgi:cytochrome c-type biogenesis protein CcmH
VIAFAGFAALMLGLALALVLRPLLRARRPDDPAAAARRRMNALREAHAAGVLSDSEFKAKRAELRSEPEASADVTPPRSRTTFIAAAVVALILPAASILLYRIVGEPRALDAAAMSAPAAASAGAEHGQDMDQAINGLAAKLKQNPDDAEGWALLGRAYLETQHFGEARDALKHAHDLVPADADVSVAYAEALTLSGDSHRIDSEARALLDAALKVNPKNERGLWLRGIADYQDGKFDSAITRWNELLAILPKDSTITQPVRNQIARAEAERDGRPPPPEPAGAPQSAESGGAQPPALAAPAAQASVASEGPRLTVNVALDPKLGPKVSAGDTLFVYAKAASGPPMPLAIQRMQAGQLPATVVLTDGMGMLPSMRLSQFPQIIVGARISKSGNAIAQSGDLQAFSKPLDVATTAPIALTIDQTVP